jgi:ANTAR domain
MSPGPGDSLRQITSRLDATRQEFDAQVRRFEHARARLQAAIDQLRKGRPHRQILHDSAFARLQAKLDTMPVIEQAKGVLMAQYGCRPEEAFDLLRRASQTANIKVSVLAAQIVEQVASPESRPAAIRSLPASGGGSGRTTVHRARARARQRA